MKSAAGFRIRRAAPGRWAAELRDARGLRVWHRADLPTIDAAIEAVQRMCTVRVLPPSPPSKGVTP